MNCGLKNYTKVDYRRYHRSYQTQLQTQLFRSLKFFRLYFRNCKSCVYNCDDPLSYKNYYIYPVNKPELKKKKRNGRSLQQPQFTLGYDFQGYHFCLKGKTKIMATQGLQCSCKAIIFSFLSSFFFFFLNGTGRTVMCSLYIYTASQYLMEILP